MNVDGLIAHDGYWALFALIALESLGIPLPGEAILIAAGTYAGHTHRLNVWVIWMVAAAAAIVGDNIGYWIGSKGGYPLLRRYGRYIRLKEPEIKVGRYVFDRYGASVVFFGRFVSILRTYAAFLAGTNKMRWHKFLVFNMAGGIVWAGVYSFASYYLGDALTHASGDINWILAGVAVVAVFVTIMLVRRASKRLEILAEAAYPGPLPD
jgi:membrane protein DedA with SNARE-associated domain